MSGTESLRPEEIADMEVLSQEECWSILREATIGRLAIRVGDGADIFPVNFLVNDHVIYIRSAPGSKLVDITQAPSVAFEVDGRGRRTYWSIVVKGKAERMSYDSEIRESGVLTLSTLTSSVKWNYIRIAPVTVTGRRFVGEH